MKQKIETFFLIIAAIIVVAWVYFSSAPKLTFEQKAMFIIVVVLPVLFSIFSKIPFILWKILGFIIIFWLLISLFGWTGAISLSMLFFGLFYYIYHQGVEKGENKVIDWLKKTGYEKISNNYQRRFFINLKQAFNLDDENENNAKDNSFQDKI